MPQFSKESMDQVWNFERDWGGGLKNVLREG